MAAKRKGQARPKLPTWKCPNQSKTWRWLNERRCGHSWMESQPDERQWAPRDGYVTPAPDVAWLAAPWDDAIDGYDAQPSTVTRPDPAPEPVAERADDLCPGCGEANDTVADALCRGCQARAVMHTAQLARVIAAPDAGGDLATARAELVRLGVLVPDSWHVAA